MIVSDEAIKVTGDAADDGKSQAEVTVEKPHGLVKLWGYAIFESLPSKPER